MTYNLFEDHTSDAWHAYAERDIVAKPSTKLQHLQLGSVAGSIQSHSQQSTDTCRGFSTLLAATMVHSKMEKVDLHNLIISIYLCNNKEQTAQFKESVSFTRLSQQL